MQIIKKETKMNKITNKFIKLSEVISLMAFLLVPTAAHAQFPGTNGRIIWTTPLQGQYTIKPDGSNINGTGLATISTTGFDGWQSVYTPNGNYIVSMGVASSGAASNLYVTNAAHTITPVAITNFTTCNVGDPALNSTGTKIAFGCYNGTTEDLYVIDLNISGSTITGSNQIKLTNLINDVGTYNPVWAPDNSVIYARNLQDIISIDPTTANQTTGTTIYQVGSGFKLNDINPGNTKLLYSISSGGGDSLYTVGIDGTSNAQLATGYLNGHYSPDGTKIVANVETPQSLKILNSTTGAAESTIPNVSTSTVGVQIQRPMWGTNQDTFADSNNGNLTPNAPNTASAKKFSKNYAPIALASAAATLFVGLLAYFGKTELDRRKKRR
jgi:hypothetical protein